MLPVLTVLAKLLITARVVFDFLGVTPRFLYALVAFIVLLLLSLWAASCSPKSSFSLCLLDYHGVG